MMETQIQPIDMTPLPPLLRPKENEVVMPVPASVASHGSVSHNWRSRIVDGLQIEMIENEIANDSSVDHSRRSSESVAKKCQQTQHRIDSQRNR